MGENISQNIKVLGVRANFVRLAKPEKFMDGLPKYSVTFSFDIDDASQRAEAAKVKATIEDLAKRRWPNVADQKKALTAKPLFKSGEDGDENFPANVRYFQACNYPDKDHAVVMVDSSLRPCSAGVFYSGCYVDAMVQLYTWDNKFGKGIGARLTHIKFKRDGEPLGGGSAPAAAEDVFDAEDGAAQDDGL